jgi:hypothetical protein
LTSAKWFCIPITKPISHGAGREPSDSIANLFLDTTIGALGNQAFDTKRSSNFHLTYIGAPHHGEYRLAVDTVMSLVLVQKLAPRLPGMEHPIGRGNRGHGPR